MPAAAGAVGAKLCAPCDVPLLVPVHAWPRVGTAQGGDFVPQHEELEVLTGGRAAHQQDQSEHLPEDQVQQAQRHSGITSGRQSPLVIDASPTCDTPHQYSVGFQNPDAADDQRFRARDPTR